MAEITLLNGLAGGLVATAAMTAFMLTLGDDSPPPTALFWSRYVGNGDPDDYMAQGMVLHVLYGVGAGVVFALALPVAGVTPRPSGRRRQRSRTERPDREAPDTSSRSGR